MESFFLSKTENEDWLYSQIRDCSERAEIKKQIECLWEKKGEYGVRLHKFTKNNKMILSSIRVGNSIKM